MTDPAELPDNWDWVTARAKCSAEGKFADLLTAIGQSVDRRNVQIDPPESGPKDRFSITPLLTRGDRMIQFNVCDLWTRRCIKFALTDQAIEISEGEQDYRLSLTLNNEGRCQFVLNGAELDTWQVAKHFLERLLFD